MRKVVLYMQSTLNGLAMGDDNDMNWLTVSDQTWEVVGELQERCDTVLLGRNNYEEFLEFWPGAASDDSLPAGMYSHARWLTSNEKVVFTKTLTSASWQNTTLVSDDVVAEVSKLKESAGKDLLLLGGVGIVNAFARNNLIDEIRLLVNPTTLASGKQLFSSDLTLKLVEAKPFESGVVALHYER
ncbi:dihydrofolate reductase family protein [Actinophytocola sediminis]